VHRCAIARLVEGVEPPTYLGATNFTRNRAWYLKSYKLLDHDKDGIACEKH
jgi:hypothetical protein